MKKLFIVILVCIVFVAFKNESTGFELKGVIKGISNGMVYLEEFRGKNYFVIDSAQIKNELFTFKGNLPTTSLYGLSLSRGGYPAVFFLENKKFSVHFTPYGEIEKVENSPVNELFFANKELVSDDGYNIDSLVTCFPDSPVAAYFLYNNFLQKLPFDKLKAIRSRLSPQLNSLQFVVDMDNIIGRLEKVQIGRIAPDFSLPDTIGTPVSLSSFRGKYVLIAFWASWCGPCRKENMNVVAVYDKFKDKNFTIIGISLDEKKKDWLNAIHKDKLEWTHVSELKSWKSDITKLYAIPSVSSNVLINPEGMIIAKNLRGKALSVKLEELLK